MRNAGRFLQEAGMDAVKLEGGRERLEAVRAIVAAGIPVMGHLGLTPQSVHQLGGFRPQGREAAAAQRLLEDALLLQEAGCFSLVLESVPARLAELDLRAAGHPHHRHRRRGRLRRAGAGDPRPAGPVRPLHARASSRNTPTCTARWQRAFAAYKAEVEEPELSRAEEHTVEMPEEEWAGLVAEDPLVEPDATEPH